MLPNLEECEWDQWKGGLHLSHTSLPRMLVSLTAGARLEWQNIC